MTWKRVAGLLACSVFALSIGLVVLPIYVMSTFVDGIDVDLNGEWEEEYGDPRAAADWN